MRNALQMRKIGHIKKTRLRERLKLCLVTKPEFPIHQNWIHQAVLGGVTMVQLREKSNVEVLRSKAIVIQRILQPFNIPLIINDDVDLAAEIGADGVHLGQKDMHPDEARSILGPNKIIGLSIESLEQLQRSNELTSIDYITASAVFPSKTKPDCEMIWGLEGLSQVVELSKHPVTAIGGVKLHNIEQIMTAGACGVAVVGAIYDAIDPGNMAKSLREAIDRRTGEDQRQCL